MRLRIPIRLIAGLLLFLMVLCDCSAMLAVPIQDVPNPRRTDGGWVTDSAQILNPETEAALNQMISRLERSNGAEIAVVTVPNTAPSATPKQFATELFNAWGIGKKGIDNGVLVLISKGDHRVEIETGRGIEQRLPNAEVRQIIQQKILPHLRQGNFSAGALSGTGSLITSLQSQPTSASRRQRPLNSSPTYHASYMGLLLVLGCLLSGILGILGWSISLSRPTFVPPEGKSRTNFRKDFTVKCKTCRQPMAPVEPNAVTVHLSQPEQVARSLGSIRIDGWECSICKPQLTNLGMHLRIHVLDDYHFSVCPNCQELTVKRTREVVQNPSAQQLQRIVEQCQCCDYYGEAWVPYSDASAGSSADTGISDGGFSVSSGGDFGGGGSDGGGTGGSW